MEHMNSKVTYKPMHKNPVDKNRSPTDIAWLCIFGFLLIAWFATNCTYLIKGNFHNFLPQDDAMKLIQNQTTLGILTEFYYDNGFGLISWIVIFGTIIFLLLLRTLSCLPKFWTAIGVCVIFASICYFLTQNFIMIYVMGKSQNQSKIVVIYLTMSINLIQVLFLGGALSAFKKAKLENIRELVKKTSHAIFFFPSFFLFGLIVLVLILAIIAFTAASLSSIDNIIVSILSLLGGVYMIRVISNFAAMVISQSVSTWYWSENREELSGFIILKSIGLIGRNHFGSILFCSTKILAIALSLFVLSKNKFQAPPNSGFISFLIKFHLVFYAADYGLIVTASNGVNVHEATKKIYSIFTRSCAIVLSFKYVIDAILNIFLAITVIISFGLGIALFPHNPLYNSNVHNIMPTLMLIYGIGTILLVTVLEVSSIAASAVIVNATEKIEENEERDMTEIGANSV